MIQRCSSTVIAAVVLVIAPEEEVSLDSPRKSTAVEIYSSYATYM